ncbi:Isoaspartyl peptidase/L-asparaginase [Trichinella pseudospiralis]
MLLTTSDRSIERQTSSQAGSLSANSSVRLVATQLPFSQSIRDRTPSRFLTDDSCVQSLDSKAPGTVSRSNQTLLINLYMTGQ